MASNLVHSLRIDSVSSLRLRDVCPVKPSQSVQATVKAMATRHTGCALVLDGEQLLGIFTERDFLSRVVAVRGDVRQPVQKVMTPSPVTINSRASIHAAIELMEAGGYRHLPVVREDGHPIGVLSIKDIVHYLVEYFPANVYNLPPTPGQEQQAQEGA